MTWHQQSTQAALDTLRTSVEGLTTTEAERRLYEHGLNVLVEGKRRTSLEMFFDQFRDFMIILLRAAGAGRRSADVVMAVGLRWWLPQRSNG